MGKNLLLVILLPILGACSNAALTLVNTLASFGGYRLTPGLPYGTDALNKLDIYQPDTKQYGDKAKGTVIFFYGGCWGACTTHTREGYRFVAQALTSQGYIVVIPDYRRYPEVLFPQIMLDSAEAVTWVSDNIARFGGRAEQIFLMGHSAGGHIAAMLTVNEDHLGAELHKNIRGFIGLAAPYDFIFDQPYMPKLFADMRFSDTQPSHFVDGKEPPLLLLYGEDDTKVYLRNIINMTDMVQKKGGRVEPHIYKDVDHVDILAALSIPYRGRYKIMNHITDFLQRQGGLSSPDANYSPP